MVVVPADTPDITIVRPLNVFGYDDAPHGHAYAYAYAYAYARTLRFADGPDKVHRGAIAKWELGKHATRP